MQLDLNRVIEQVSKEKGIDRQIIVKALEEAMLSAAKKTFGHDKNIEAQFNTELGEVELFEIKTVVDQIQDAENEVTLAEARTKLDPDAEVGDQLLAKLPKVTVPAIVMYGTTDGVAGAPPAEAADRGNFPGLIGRRVVDGAGHFLPRERPDEVSSAMLQCLRHGR